jgi:ABC-type Fe3+-citrate transport system substrate-binding protein
MLSKPNTIFILGNNKLFSFILNYKLSFVNRFEVVSFNTAKESLEQINLKPDIIVFDKNYSELNSFSQVLSQFSKISPTISTIILFDKRDELFVKELKMEHNCECLLRDEDSSKMADKLIQVIQTLVKTKRQSQLFFYLSIFLFFSFIIAAYTLVKLINT